MKKVKFFARIIREMNHKLGLSDDLHFKLKHTGYSFSIKPYSYSKLIIAHTFELRNGLILQAEGWDVFCPLTGQRVVTVQATTRKQAIENANNHFREITRPAEEIMKGIALLNSAIEWKPPQ